MALFKTKAHTGEALALVVRILRENAGANRRKYVYAILFMLVLAATTAFQPLLVRYLINDVFYENASKGIASDAIREVVMLCAVIVAVFLVRGVATYASSIFMAQIGNGLIARYQGRLFEHLMKLDIGFFGDRRSGALAAQLNENVISIRDMVGITLTTFARDLTTAIALLGAMIYMDPVFSLITFLIGPPLALGVSYLSKRIRTAAKRSVEVNSRLVGALQETTQGIAVVKAFTMEEQLKAKMNVLITEAEQRSNRIAFLTERLSPITESLAGFAIAGVIALAGYIMARDGTPPGSLVGFIVAFFLAYEPVKRLARLQVGLERALVNARMIYEILDTEPRQRDNPGATELAVAKGEVNFKDVSFAYVENNPVLDKISFIAKAGQTTAIVGASGAGKSTLFALLERFYDTNGGAILVDGQDISRVTKSSLRRAVAFVSQQPYLFEGTIRDNIRYGRADASDAEIEQAAKLANADEFIRQQPQGYDTQVGENGASLSGGQRQRLSIARAIVRNAPILLLDEATSALDNESEAKVQAALTQIMKDRTTIVIAHRLSTVVNANQIIVMEQGQIVERGTHAKLLKEDKGVYARFYRLQANKSADLIDSVAQVEPAAAGSTI